MYNEVDIEFTTHDKTKAAADILGIKAVYVAGHILALWEWAMKNAKDGDLSRFPSRIIARAADWEGDPEVFIGALVGCAVKIEGAGYLERVGGSLFLHEWENYGGKLFVERVKDAQRKRDEREAKKAADAQILDGKPASAGRPKDVRGTSGNVRPKHSITEHSITEQSEAEHSAPARGNGILHDADAHAAAELVRFLVSAGKAEKLVRTYGADRCLKQIAWLPCRNGVHNPPAFLVSAIENDEPEPAGWSADAEMRERLRLTAERATSKSKQLLNEARSAKPDKQDDG